MRRAVVMIVVSFVAGTAHAQAPAGGSNTLAEQLFAQARDLAKANQWAEACPKFEASLRYDPVLGTRLNLATCYEHIGKIASAWGLYRESIELAKKANDPKRAAYAQKQAAALEPRLPKLAISPPANPPVGFVVKRDDTAVDAGAFGVGLYVDPGLHKVIASAPGFVEVTLSVTLAEGKTEALAIPELVAKPDAPSVATTKPVQPVDDTPAAPPSKTRRYAALGVGGAGVVAVGLGLVFGAKASSSYSDAKKLCGDDMVCPAESFTQDQQLVSDARSSATISTVLVIGGGAAIATGVILYLTAPRGRERATARLVPVPHQGGAGLALTGAF
ncbi:MAG: tetratricopeptide repeat protein [Kofleriaceae bacterium]